MYEHRKQRLLTRWQFARRVLAHTGFAVGAIALALFGGIAGYHYVAGFNWVDALLNASMILGGMGPVDPLHSNAAKVFASFIGILAVVLAAFLHHLMHRLHMEENDEIREQGE